VHTHILNRVARRADPKRIFVARRIAVRNWLSAEGMSEPTAEAWCDAWEAEASRLELDRASSEYWPLGSAWIHEQRKTEQRKTRKLPE
jgi:hypothetical protein